MGATGAATCAGCAVGAGFLPDNFSRVSSATRVTVVFVSLPQVSHPAFEPTVSGFMISERDFTVIFMLSKMNMKFLALTFEAGRIVSSSGTSRKNRGFCQAPA